MFTFLRNAGVNSKCKLICTLTKVSDLSYAPHALYAYSNKPFLLKFACETVLAFRMNTYRNFTLYIPITPKVVLDYKKILLKSDLLHHPNGRPNIYARHCAHALRLKKRVFPTKCVSERIHNNNKQ